MKAIKSLLLVTMCLTSVVVFSQDGEDGNVERQSLRRIAKMEKVGFAFKNRKGLEGRFESMLAKRFELNDGGDNTYLILETTTKHKDQQIAEDLMKYKITVDLASKIKGEILQTIETELMQSNKYWELGGHSYFLEVQQAIDEVSLSTAVNLAPLDVVYEASRQSNKNYEYTVGHIYDRKRMLDLFIFAASDYEILDSIYWLTKDEPEP